MLERKDGLYFQSLQRSHPDALKVYDDKPEHLKDVLFAMHCNGYTLNSNCEWRFNADSIQPYLEEFEGQEVSFFGPNSNNSFYSKTDFGYERFTKSFSLEPVTKMVNRFRNMDEDLAARICFILGGVIRERTAYSRKNSLWLSEVSATGGVEMISEMLMLGDKWSGDAVASAMAMYYLSSGKTRVDERFKGDTFGMAEAVSDDPILPKETKDLGLSQTSRLHMFINRGERGNRFLPDISQPEADLANFPTVGAEFHFPVEAQDEHPYFWQRLALLNMSQYQKGSYIQLCRNDRGVIEVRMNPSVYPVAIANWNHMRVLLPELNKAFFTATFNLKSAQD